MSPKRPPGPPPGLPGYQYLSLLGSGGFSDVYLYEQDQPRRRVAVKVLLSDLKSEGARNRFESEANLMAQLSSHPYIVTIYEARITADGHSYLAMEYCSRPSLDVRYRRGRLGVDEALAMGIQVASAVETAHRAGIAHRDIKPANVLITDYNRPALTDFGISGTVDSVAADEAGMSIPWSPPEAFHGRNVDGVRTDIWALGATIYTLLAGRSPFVLPGADNSQRGLMSRIGTAPLPRLGRADVPDSLELALGTAMSKAPDGRFASAHAFALALQRVQAELNMSLTPFEVLEDSASQQESGVDDGGVATRVRQVVSIDPAPGAPPGPEASAEPVLPVGPATSAGLDTTSPNEAYPDTALDHTPRSKRKMWLVASAAVVLIAAVVAGLMLGSTGNGVADPEPTGLASQPADAVDGFATVPAPANLTAERVEDGAVFSWRNPDPQPGDVFMWRPVTVTGKGEYAPVEKPEVRVELRSQGQTCIDVVIRRGSGKYSVEPATACVP
ncbi:serine/threonine-protein kinase [Arthrobacter monumenti]